MKQQLIVVGNGMAGARFVEELVRRGGSERFDITVFGDEPRGNYNRILLSGVLNGTHAADSITLHPLEWYQAHGICLRAGEKVTSIDRACKQVLAGDGSAHPYDVLVLATGSRPFVPPLEGLKEDGKMKDGVFVMRTLDDCDCIASFAPGVGRAAVVGGGLLGLEAARGLGRFGAHVSVVHRSGHLMNQQLDAPGGAMLQAQIEKLGIEVLLNRETRAVLGHGRVSGLQFADGSTLACEMVVVACGIAPRVELARECGLAVERAVVVDDQMRSADDPSIFAVGECAQHRGIAYGLVAPLWEQGRVLADVLSGRKPRAIYAGSKPSTKLKVLGVTVASMGEVEAAEGDEEVLYCEARRGIYKRLLIRDEKLVGAILLGDGHGFPALSQSFERGTPLPAERAALLFDIEGGAPASAAALPDEATICNCNGVSKGAVKNCIAGGACSMDAVMSQTRAGTGCGSCKSQLKELLAAAPSTSSASSALDATRNGNGEHAVLRVA
jgi:nitrite reductase (NADH) large subunit